MNTYILLTFIVLGLLGGWITLIFKKSSLYFTIILCMLFVILVSLRDIYIVPDTIEYIKTFESIKTNVIYNQSNLPTRFEIGFIYFSQILKVFIGDNYKLYFTLITIINILLTSISYKKILDSTKSSINHLVLFMLYFCYYGFYYNAIVLRGGIALSLILLAISFALINKWKSSLLIIIIAFSFHQSAIIGLIIILVLKFKLNLSRKFYFLSWIVIGLIYYTNSGPRFVINFINYLLYLFPNPWFLNYSNRLVYNDLHSNWFLFMYLIGGLFIFINSCSINYKKLLNLYFLGLLILSLVHGINIIERITDYFTISSFILFYIFLKNIRSILLKCIFYAGYIIANLYVVINIVGIY